MQGKHAKLGELIGKAVKSAVKTAVKEALLKQSGLGPAYQHSLLKRWRRYGLTEESLWVRKNLKIPGNIVMPSPNKVFLIQLIKCFEEQIAMASFQSRFRQQNKKNKKSVPTLFFIFTEPIPMFNKKVSTSAVTKHINIR